MKSDQPYAEYWSVPTGIHHVTRVVHSVRPISGELIRRFGTHPSGPATVTGSPLSSWLAEHPEALGSLSTAELPYLFKVGSRVA